MNVFLRVLAVLIVLAVVGGAAFLLMWDIPPPSAKIEKILPDDQFPK